MKGGLPIGELFERRYRIDGKLGSGGFGIVYVALDIATGSDVAIKLLTIGRGTLDAAARARFEREIAIVGRLRSPHTVELLGHGDADGVPYAVFEYIRGRDLNQFLAQRGRLQPGEVIQIIEQVCVALAEAHDLGLLHRDLKPANIRLDETDGQLTVKLLDFGIARHRDGSHPSITRTGELIGTPRYMSPEQLMDQDLGPSSDIYSLGMVAFELLMGAEVLGTVWADQIGRLRSGHVFSMPELERVSPELLVVIQQMTSRQPQERYQEVAEVLDALANLGAVPALTPPEPREVTPAEAATTQRVDPGSWSGVLGIALVAAFVVVAVIVTTRVFDHETSPPRDVPPALLETQTTTALLVADAGPSDADLSNTTSADMTTNVGPIDIDGGSSGCGVPPPFLERGAIDGTLTYVPERYTGRAKVPLVVLLHQTFESAEDLLGVSGFEPLSNQHGFIIAAPEHPDLFASWKREDLALPTIRRTIDTMSQSFCVDVDRVYIVSNGHGGRVAMLGSCEDYIRGTAIHSFGNNSENHHCFEAEPAPHILITPRSSPHVPFHGGKSCSVRLFQGDKESLKQSVQQLETDWKRRNRCSGEPEVVFRDGDSVCRRWSCEAPFQSCYVEGGNGWTGSAPRAVADIHPCDGPAATRVELAPLIWSFFDHAEQR